MAKKVIIKDRTSKEVEYPITLKECVINSDGSSVFEDYVTHEEHDKDKETLEGLITTKMDKSLFWIGTKADYSSILNKDNDVFYFIIEEE